MVWLLIRHGLTHLQAVSWHQDVSEGSAVRLSCGHGWWASQLEEATPSKLGDGGMVGPISWRFERLIKVGNLVMIDYSCERFIMIVKGRLWLVVCDNC